MLITVQVADYELFVHFPTVLSSLFELFELLSLGLIFQFLSRFIWLSLGLGLLCRHREKIDVGPKKGDK